MGVSFYSRFLSDYEFKMIAVILLMLMSNNNEGESKLSPSSLYLNALLLVHGMNNRVNGWMRSFVCGRRS